MNNRLVVIRDTISYSVVIYIKLTSKPWKRTIKLILIILTIFERVASYSCKLTICNILIQYEYVIISISSRLLMKKAKGVVQFMKYSPLMSTSWTKMNLLWSSITTNSGKTFVWVTVQLNGKILEHIMRKINLWVCFQKMKKYKYSH